MKKWQIFFSPYLIAIILGALLTTSFAPYEIFPLAIFALFGLLILWNQRPPSSAFALGFLFGLGFFGTGVYWVYISMHYFGGLSPLLATLITTLLICYMAFFPAFIGYFTQRFFSHHSFTKLTLAFPAIWVFSEWFRSWLFTGFPWLIVGYSQTNSPLKGYAPLLSVYGVSLSVLMTSGLLFHAYLKLKQKEFKSFYFSLLIITGLWTIGGLLDLISWTETVPKSLSVSLVQGNISQTIKWSPEYLQFSLDRYAIMTQPLWKKSKLIIWPESAIPLALDEAHAYVAKLQKLATNTNTTLIMGIPIRAGETNDYYNAVIALGAQNQIYLKRHLVPFGEYTPFANILMPVMSYFNIPISVLIPGDFEQTTITVDHVKILMAICYEIAFPELMFTNDPSVGMMLTVTNDAWFGKSAAQAQHLQMAKFRAIELRRPAIMVSNDGITAIIDTKGNIAELVQPYSPQVLKGKILPVKGLTPWMKTGTDPIFVILLSFLFIAARQQKKISKNLLQKESILISEKNNLT